VTTNLSNSHDFIIGSTIVAAIAAIPDDALSVVGKSLLFVVTAFVSGFAYTAGRWAWDRFVRGAA
jgi:hypothetical protein